MVGHNVRHFYMIPSLACPDMRLADTPMPEVRPEDLLVKVMAAGVNRADLLQREGVYGSQSYGDVTSSASRSQEK